MGTGEKARAGEVARIEARLVSALETVEARIAARADEISAGGGRWSIEDYEEDDFDLGVVAGLSDALRIVRGA